MGFFDKIKEFNKQMEEKKQGRNIYLLGKNLPKDASELVKKGYYDAQARAVEEDIKELKIKKKTAKLKLQQTQEKEKQKLQKIKDKCNTSFGLK